jgi:serine/threonine protein kinase
MPREPGASLGSYSVAAKIGEGGMGEVYRARDISRQLRAASDVAKEHGRVEQQLHDFSKPWNPSMTD